MQNLRNFLNELQSSNQERKKKWLIGGTAIAMIFVLIAWSFYITQTIKNLNSVDTGDKPSFSVVFKSGLKIFQEELTSKVENFMGQAKSLNISGASFNFTAENLQKIEPKKISQ